MEIVLPVPVIVTVAAAIAAVASLVTTMIALIYTMRSDRRQSGLHIRYSYVSSQSIASREPWISELSLQNMKGRPVVVYKIYLEIGHGLFVLIEDRATDPIILNEYGVYQQKYEPIEYYAAGGYKIVGLNDVGLLLSKPGGNRKRRRLLLATAQGRYRARPGIEIFDPWIEMVMGNRPTIVATPQRWTYEGRSYGSGTRYIIVTINALGEREVLPIYSLYFVNRDFLAWGMTEQTLASKENLETFLREQIANGNLDVLNVEVVDPEPYRAAYTQWIANDLQVFARGWFAYRIRPRWDRAQSVTTWKNRLKRCWDRIGNLKR